MCGQRGERAPSGKEIRYAAHDRSYIFVPLTFETYKPINNKGSKFLQELAAVSEPQAMTLASQRSSFNEFRLPCSASIPLLFLTLSPRPLRQSLRPNHFKHCF